MPRVESQNSVELSEKYLSPPRRIHNITNLPYPRSSHEIKFAIAVESINDTINYDALVPSLLLSGAFLLFPSVN